MAKASDFKFGTELGFAKAHHKITPRGKSEGAFGLVELPNILGFSIIFLQRLGLVSSNLVNDLGLLRPTVNPLPEKNWEWP